MADNSKTPRTIGAAFAARLPENAPEPEGRDTVRATKVRMTVPIEPELHRELSSWTHSIMLATGQTRVTISDAVRAMVRVTLADSATAKKVQAEMKRAS